MMLLYRLVAFAVLFALIMAMIMSGHLVYTGVKIQKRARRAEQHAVRKIYGVFVRFRR